MEKSGEPGVTSQSKLKRYSRLLLNKQILIVMLMGFSSGLPLALTGSTLKARLADSGVDLTTAGFFSLLGIPYTLKLLWAPFFDRYSFFGGRRRGWLLLTQVSLVVMIAVLGVIDPSHMLPVVAVAALLTAFVAASQDIAIDAYRREILNGDQFAFGMNLAISAYRIAMLVSGGVALILTQVMSWNQVYLLMAVAAGVGILTTLWADEPKVEGTPPKTLREAYAEPLKEIFSRKNALLILLFIFLYKLGDAMALEQTMYFYKNFLGFTNIEIGAIVKGAGLFGVLAGGFIGSIWIIRFGLLNALYVFGFMQIAAILGFAFLATQGHNISLLTTVILFENLTVGCSTAAYATYLAMQTNKRFTAAQYALFSSITGLPRVIFGSTTGWMAAQFGWTSMFLFCAALGLPALVILFKIGIPKNEESAPAV